MTARASLADVVARDIAKAYARFSAQHGKDRIYGLALCTVNDAVPPYVMGNTLEQVIGEQQESNDVAADEFFGNPPDWRWTHPGGDFESGAIIGEILEDESRSFEDQSSEIF